MTITNLLNEAQHLNKMLISEAETDILSLREQKLQESNKLFENILDQVLYDDENKDHIYGQFIDVCTQNRVIFQKLFTGEYSQLDAEVASNTLFINFFNNLRSPGIVHINILQFRTNNQFVNI